jgi:hypothetical protein
VSLHVRRAVVGGFERVLTRNGALLAAALVAASALQGAFVWAVGTSYVPLGAGGATPPGAPAPGATPPAVVSGAAALLAGLAGTVLTAPVRVVAVRTLVDDGRDRIPDRLVFRATGWTTLRFVVASLLQLAVLFVLVVVGTVVAAVVVVVALALLPASLRTGLAGAWYAPAAFAAVTVVGLFPAAFAFLTFAFVGQELAVRDATVPEAFLRSWRVVARNRLRLAAAVGLPYAFNVGFSLLVAQVAPQTTFRSTGFLLRQAVLSVQSGVVSVVVVGITSQAWVQLTGVDGPLDEYWGDETGGSAPRDDGTATVE